MSVTIKQVIIGTVLGTTVVGMAVLRLRKERMTQPQPTQIASLKRAQVHKKHTKGSEAELSSRKLLG